MIKHVKSFFRIWNVFAGEIVPNEIMTFHIYQNCINLTTAISAYLIKNGVFYLNEKSTKAATHSVLRVLESKLNIIQTR